MSGYCHDCGHTLCICDDFKFSKTKEISQTERPQLLDAPKDWRTVTKIRARLNEWKMGAFGHKDLYDDLLFVLSAYESLEKEHLAVRSAKASKDLYCDQIEKEMNREIARLKLDLADALDERMDDMPEELGSEK